MNNLNNLDIIILIVIGISALIALSRGLIKEVLSIIGWFLAVASVIYLLPAVNPFMEQHIDSAPMAAVVSSFCIIIIFFVIWIYLTASIIGKIRKSKLSGLDRILGLFFGVFRAFLLIVLFYILINWMVPKEKQSDSLTQSKYFNIAGSFAQPIEALIPESTLEKIREHTQAAGGKIEAEDSDDEVEAKLKKKTDVDVLFEMLAQPKVGKKKTEDKPVAVIKSDLANKITEASKKKEEPKKEEKKADEKSYNEHERDNLDRLIENTSE